MSRSTRRIGVGHLLVVIAIVIALSGGSAYAASKIGTNQIKNGAITSAKLHNRAVTAAKIGPKAVTSSKIEDNAVTSSKIRDNAVTPDKMSDYTDSGLVKLDNGQSRLLLERGPFTFTATCVDAGAGASTARLIAKNTGSTAALFESDGESNYADPIFDPGEELNAFYGATDSTPYWFGEYYNLFSATSSDGSTSLMGQGNLGVKVLGSDCVFQLFTFGS